MPYETADNYETGIETLEAEQFEFESGGPDAAEGPFEEVEEMELATQLLEVTDEAELDQFIGNIFKKAASAVGRAIKSPIGQHLGGLVKGAIKKALPGVGAAIGGYLVPGAGAAVGSQLASRAGDWLGLELEGLSPEDQEFELAKQLVRLAGTAARHAVSAASAGASPGNIARQALTKAARQYAPGLLRSVGRSIPGIGGLFGETADEFEMDQGETDSPFSEVEESEFASQLLEVTDEAELDQFIGSLLKKAGKAVGSIVKSPLGQHLGGLVKGAIKKALPTVGGALGGAIPGVGSALGSRLASRGGQLLGLELEGSSSDEQMMDLAKRLIRLAGSAVQQASTSPVGNPAATARTAVAKAARRHLPGLLRAGRGRAAGMAGQRARSDMGRWVRRGGSIVLMGA